MTDIDFYQDPVNYCIEALSSDDSNERYNAADILRGLAGEAEPALVAICQHIENDSDIEVRRQCVFALIDIGAALKQRANQCLPYLEAVKNEDDAELCELAQLAIAEICS